MVKIRLARGGAKKKPFYSVVIVDSRKPRDSGYIERIGYFNPIAKGQEVRLKLDLDKISTWQTKGAQLTERVKQLIKEVKNPDLYKDNLAKKQLKIAAKLAKEKVKKTATKDELDKEKPELKTDSEAEKEKLVKTDAKPDTKTQVADKKEAKTDTKTQIADKGKAKIANKK